MKERPILFSASMVRALLAGRKTQTRRIVKSPHVADADRWRYSEMLGQWESGISGEGGVAAHGEYVRCPYGEPGDLLWAKETWRAASDLDDKSPSAMATACVQEAGYARAWAPIEYVADGEHRDWRPWGTGGGDATAGKVRSPLHMPRWASRITLRVTSVRVERLQAISDADAKAEGVDEMDGMVDDAAICRAAKTAGVMADSRAAQFGALWDSINGKRAPWSANPWVWVVGFEVADAARKAA